MPNKLHYSCNVRWSDEDEAFVATVPELPGVSGIGDTVDQAAAEAHVAAELAVKVLEEDGAPVPEPELLPAYSGQFRGDAGENMTLLEKHWEWFHILVEARGQQVNVATVTRLPSGKGFPLMIAVGLPLEWPNVKKIFDEQYTRYAIGPIAIAW